MTPESWFKIALPAYPVLFTIIGVWLYWGDNPAPLLAPSIAFWGVVVLFYSFSHIYVVENRYYPLYLIMGVTVLWVVSAITSHNLGRFVSSSRYTGLGSLMRNKDFWYAYLCAILSSAAGLGHFVRYEPLIVKQVEKARISSESGAG